MGEWNYVSTVLHFGIRLKCLVSFTPRSLNSGGKAISTQWIGGWLNPRAGLDAVKLSKISFTCRELNVGRAGMLTEQLATISTGSNNISDQYKYLADSMQYQGWKACAMAYYESGFHFR
jgi:hypothetical protein